MNYYIIAYAILTLLTLWSVTYPIYVAINGRKTTFPGLRLGTVFLILSIVPGFIGTNQAAHERDQESYDAWVKHTENPNKLSLHEWQALNRNYVPRSKHERRTIQPETE